MAAITRTSLENDITRALIKVDINPSFDYGSAVMAPPVTFIIKEDHAYAYGPDGYIWMAEVVADDDGQPRYINWADAGPLHIHLEYMYGELYKLRMNDDELFIVLSAHAFLARELMAAFLVA